MPTTEQEMQQAIHQADMAREWERDPIYLHARSCTDGECATCNLDESL